MSRTFLLSALSSLGALAFLALVVLRFPGPPPVAAPAGGAVSREVLERLERLERGLTRLADLESEVSRLAAREAAVPGPAQAAQEPRPAPAAESPPLEAERTESEGAPAAARFERWLEANGFREEMDTYIAQVYEAARKARREREESEAAQRRRELEELFQGPYGNHNYKVNLLAKRLDLDRRQMEYLHWLLTQFEERASGLKKVPEGVKLDPQQFEEHLRQLKETRKALEEGLEGDFLAGLSAEQREAYQELPEAERVASPSGYRVKFLRRAAEDAARSGEIVAPVEIKIDPPPFAPPAPVEGR